MLISIRFFIKPILLQIDRNVVVSAFLTYRIRISRAYLDCHRRKTIIISILCSIIILCSMFIGIGFFIKPILLQIDRNVVVSVFLTYRIRISRAYLDYHRRKTIIISILCSMLINIGFFIKPVASDRSKRCCLCFSHVSNKDFSTLFRLSPMKNNHIHLMFHYYLMFHAY